MTPELLDQLKDLVGAGTVLVLAALGVLYTAATVVAAVAPPAWRVTQVCARLAADLRQLLKLPPETAKLVPVLLVLGGLALPACGIFTPVAKQPCPGLYCVGVETAGVPGTALLCYESEAQLLAAKATLAARGCAEVEGKLACPRGVTP